jgi:hypothetical protein
LLVKDYTTKQRSKVRLRGCALLLLFLASALHTGRVFAADDDDFFADEENILSLQTPKVIRVIDANGDTIPHIVIPPVFCFAKTKTQKFRNKRTEHEYYQQYYRMIANLKKVYPYAQLIKQRLAAIEHEYAQFSTDRERKAYMKRVEKELVEEFKPIARKMTVSQGKLLIKLVNRETGKTGYTIVKELRGTMSAFFWQTIAVLFSTSLKIEFDPNNDDKLLSELIYLYESGML